MQEQIVGHLTRVFRFSSVRSLLTINDIAGEINTARYEFDCRFLSKI